MMTTPDSAESRVRIDVNISQVKVLPEFRVGVDDNKVIDEYQRLVSSSKSWWPFDTPCTLYRVDGMFLLTDGFEQFEAIRRGGKSSKVHAYRHNGTRSKALLAALSSQCRPERTLSEEHKRKALNVALNDELLKSWTDEQLADLVNVPASFVSQVRRKEEPVEREPEPSHIELLEMSSEKLKETFKLLKKLEGWSETSERIASVRRFMKLCRRLGNEFEKFTTVGAEPAKTLFEEDADIPEHLNTQEFNEAWRSWWDSRRKRRMSVSHGTKKRQLKQLAIGDSEQATAIVSKAEENGWQGIPDNVWIPKFGEGLWCGRMPSNASEELKKKISAALPIGFQAGQKVVAPLQVDRSGWGARNNPAIEKLSVEEQRKAMLGRR